MKSTLLVATAASGLALSVPASAQDVSLIVKCFLPPQHVMCSQLLPDWLGAIETAIEGRVGGLILPTSAAPPAEQLAGVQSGQMDVAVQFNGLIPSETLGGRIAMLPFTGSDSAEQNSAALWATTREFFADEFGDTTLLSQFIITPVQLYSLTEEPIESLADLQSRRVWALPGPLAAFGNAIGAGVVATPAVESREIISRGVVDASIWLEPDTVTTFQLTRYVRSVTTFERPLYASSFSLVMNGDTWARISPQDQAAIMSVGGEAFARAVGAAWDAMNQRALETLDAAGVQFVPASDAFNDEVRDAMDFVVQAWLAEAAQAGIDGEDAIAFYREATTRCWKPSS